MLHTVSSYTLWQLPWTIFPSCTLGSKLETIQLLSIRSLCYQNQINIPGELCFLNREKEQIQSCISLLWKTKFTYLIKFSLTLILRTYKNLFSKFLFHKPLSLSRSKQICPVFLHQKTKNCRKKTIIFVQQKYLVFHNNTYPTCFTHRNVSLIIFTYHNFYSLKP